MSVHHPIRMMAAVGSEKYTYETFLAHIQDLAPNLVNGNAEIGYLSNYRRVTNLTASGTMRGTTWNSYVQLTSVLSRAIQHGMPNYLAFANQVSNNGQVLVQISWVSHSIGGTVSGLNRNSYNSLSYSRSTSQNSYTLLQLFYWDFDLNQAFRMEPRQGRGPYLYEW